jgi:K+ transporter
MHATGTEGMFADLGHFNIRAVQVTHPWLYHTRACFSFSEVLACNQLPLQAAEQAS